MLRSNVLAAKARLARGHDDFKARHAAGCPGVELCALNSNLRDAVILELVEDALQDLGQAGPKGLINEIAIVAHGGYGRRDVAPYSDVDLMILHRLAAAARLLPLAERLVRDVFDVGLVLGHSVRTVRQACTLAARDAMICTSLVDSRLLAGNPAIFESFMHTFRQRVRWRCGRLLSGIRRARDAERHRYGETVFLLEPNIKRSQGTLRDLQLLRWIGFARYGAADFAELRDCGALSREDFDAIQPAYAFLLWLRNELHFHSGQASDVLTRAEQLRLAERRGFEAADGLLPVEHFMRDYFRHTNRVSHVATKFLAKATTNLWIDKTLTLLFGHHIESDYVVGPVGMMITRSGLARLRRNLTAIMQIVDLSNLHDVPIAAFTWEEIRREAPHLPPHLPPEASRHFLSLLAHPGRLGTLLHDLHDAAILERFLPDFARARGLLQFNQYHKYTVDEHCIRAVEFAEKLLDDPGPVGRVYRGLKDKHLLHLALLIHDLGKGLLEDHREVGLKIAEQTGWRLGLQPHETEIIKFLVHKHLRMNHLALRRDTSDEELVVRFAVQVGSPELLQMLYVLTAADLGAVGPDVWDGWKSQVLTDLYHRAMQQLAGDSPATTTDHLFERKRDEIRACLSGEADEAWYARYVDSLTSGYLSAAPAAQAAADLRLLHDLEPGGVRATASYEPDAATLQVTVGTSEAVAPGIFHKLTGALTSQGLEIRSAQIHTLADGLVLDRFWVHDPDYSGEPPPDRIRTINQAVEQSLRQDSGQVPSFRRTWKSGEQRKMLVPKPQIRVNTDNSTSDRYTIIDVFAYDRTGLLYAVTRTFFELGCPVWRAKISTYLDQVVDVFYVTDRENRKIVEQSRLDTIRQRLLEVIGETEAK
ncbi:MAG: [protein-PII] uridylyltransferase [Thermoguttaceae bacterium]